MKTSNNHVHSNVLLTKLYFEPTYSPLSTEQKKSKKCYLFIVEMNLFNVHNEICYFREGPFKGPCQQAMDLKVES